MTFTWFLGWDARDELAAKVAMRSMRAHSDADVRVVLLKDHELRRAGFYWRGFEVRPNGQMIDDSDGKPFSTAFSFTRFCVPELARAMGLHGPVLFTDPDVMFRADIREAFAQWETGKAVMCVHHDHRPKEATKFDGIEQTKYFRKNWSSVMLIDPDKTHELNPQKVNNWSGAQLHALLWVKHDEQIGALDPAWNHLIGYLEPSESAALAHFTLGTPDVPGFEHQEHADEWRGYCDPDEISRLPVSGIEIARQVGGWRMGGP